MIIKDDIGIKQAMWFYNELRKELESSQSVVIDMKNAARIDLSIAQIIMAAAREAKDTGKSLKLRAVPDAVKQQLQICGFKI